MAIRHHVAVLACAVLAAACPRSARPELGEDRVVFAGIQVHVGSSDPKAPELTFDFGDASPKITGRQASHAYARAGRYSLRAFEGAVVRGSVKLNVVPRPLLFAVPPEASSVVFLPSVKGHLEASVDFLEKLMGAEAVQNLLDRSVLPVLAMEVPSTGERPAVDPQEGLGLFTLPQFDGAVAALGIIDGDRAQEELVKQLERKGGYARTEADATVRVRMPQGSELAVFLDRGYLYVALPEAKTAEPGVTLVDLTPALLAVRQMKDDGLGAAAHIARAKARLPAGDAYVFFASPPAETHKLDGLFAAFTIADRVLELDGVIQAHQPLWPAGALAGPPLMNAAPEGPVAAAYASVPPAELAALLAGLPGTPRRKSAAERARRAGIDLEALLSATSGELAALVYFDAEAFLSNLAAGTEKPEPRGALLVEAGLTRAEPFEQVVEDQLSTMELRYDRIEEKDQIRYQARVRTQPLELLLSPKSARLFVGGGTAQRPPRNLAAELRGRFGGAFGPGHLSAMLDVGQLRKELAEPRTIAGIDPRRLVMVQGFAVAFLAQFTAIDHAFLDVSADADGGRLKGRLVLKEK